MIPKHKNNLSIVLSEDGNPVNQWDVDSGAANVIGYMLDCLEEQVYVPVPIEKLKDELSESMPFIYFNGDRVLVHDIELVISECKKRGFSVVIENKIESSWVIKLFSTIGNIMLESDVVSDIASQDIGDVEDSEDNEYVKISDIPKFFEKYFPEAVKQMGLVSANEVKEFVSKAFGQISTSVK